MNDDLLMKDQLTRGSLGSYLPNSFFIFASIQIDLEPPGGSVDRLAVPVHAHEYCHLLHNLSTPAGVHFYISNLWLLRLLRAGADAHGYLRGEFFLDEKQLTM